VSGLRVPPIAAGLVAAALAFAAVALATNGDGRRAPERAARGGEAATTPAVPTQASAPSAGRAVFARMGCGSCHHLTAAGSTGGIGPNLDLRLPNHTRASLMAKILSPGQVSAMPPNFGARMSHSDLDALVKFLLAARPSR
jgi:cytochrome c5